MYMHPNVISVINDMEWALAKSKEEWIINWLFKMNMHLNWAGTFSFKACYKFESIQKNFLKL